MVFERLLGPAESLPQPRGFPASPGQTLCVERNVGLRAGGRGSAHRQLRAGWAVGPGQPGYNPSSWFPSCVTLARPGTSLSLCFVICRWANGVVMRVEQVTPGALGRTVGTDSVTPGGLGLPGLVQSPCGSPSPPWLLPSFPAGLRRPEEADGTSPSVSPQKEIPLGLNHCVALLCL